MSKPDLKKKKKASLESFVFSIEEPNLFKKTLEGLSHCLDKFPCSIEKDGLTIQAFTETIYCHLYLSNEFFSGYKCNISTQIGIPAQALMTILKKCSKKDTLFFSYKEGGKLLITIENYKLNIASDFEIILIDYEQHIPKNPYNYECEVELSVSSLDKVTSNFKILNFHTIEIKLQTSELKFYAENGETITKIDVTFPIRSIEPEKKKSKITTTSEKKKLIDEESEESEEEESEGEKEQEEKSDESDEEKEEKIPKFAIQLLEWNPSKPVCHGEYSLVHFSKLCFKSALNTVILCMNSKNSIAASSGAICFYYPLKDPSQKSFFKGHLAPQNNISD